MTDLAVSRRIIDSIAHDADKHADYAKRQNENINLVCYICGFYMDIPDRKKTDHLWGNLQVIFYYMAV